MHPLAQRLLNGDVRALARVCRLVDDGVGDYRAILRDLFPATGHAWTIGITGVPGAGKSTLTDQLIAHHRAAGRRVGVLCVDPTSPFTGGAILGDRIRMQRHGLDEGVFIRSLATRGALGGLSRSAADQLRAVDAWHADVIIVETVGVGQDELEVTRRVDTTLVVVAPGMGDDVQAIKAGILECADVFAVNKADREGADRAVRDLTHMLELRAGKAREVEIVKTVAVRGDGIGDLVGAIERYRAKAGDHLVDRRAMWARAQLGELVRDRVVAAADATLPGGFEALVTEVAARRLDPYGAVDRLLAALSVGR